MHSLEFDKERQGYLQEIHQLRQDCDRLRRERDKERNQQSSSRFHPYRDQRGSRQGPRQGQVCHRCEELRAQRNQANHECFDLEQKLKEARQYIAKLLDSSSTSSSSSEEYDPDNPSYDTTNDTKEKNDTINTNEKNDTNDTNDTNETNDNEEIDFFDEDYLR